MTVAEYIHEFTHLSRFAPDWVDTEAKKVEQFIEGLRPSIQRDVTMCQRPTTFDDAVERAYYAEQQQQNILLHEPKRNFTPSSKNSPQQSQGKKFKQGGSSQSRPVFCTHCGKGHNSSQCRRILGACFRMWLYGSRGKGLSAHCR